MKARHILALGTAVFMAVFALGACSEQPTLSDKALEGKTLADFTKGESEAFFASDGWTNGGGFNVVWTGDNVRYEGQKLSLAITEEDRTVNEGTYHYTAGEARSHLHYSYGDFEVNMKPAKKEGTASTFFTCTGNYDTGLDGEPHKHDEIDIEFLGKDTTKVQFNYFVNGQGGHEYLYSLGFDASEDYHSYGFRWEESAITWFVDGKPVYKVTKDAAHPEFPSAPGRILMNYWCGNASTKDWMGSYAGGANTATADYKWVKTSATGVDLEPKAPAGDAFEGDWSTISSSDVTFASTEKYTVTKEGDVSTVTYSDVGGSDYCNVGASIATAAADKNWVHITIKNNGTEEVQVRVNIIDDALASAQNKSTNRRAFMDGEAVRTDLEWGGSFFSIPAGKTIHAEIYFAGTPESLELMIDSSRNNATKYSGNISISEVKFAKQGEIESVGGTTEPTEPVDDTYQGDWTEVPSSDVTFASTDKYTATKDGYVTTIVYTAVGGSDYCNVGASIATAAADKNWMLLTFKNNGEEEVQVRVNIIDDALASAQNKSTNRRAFMDGEAVRTDLDWGGSFFSIPAGKTVKAEIYFAGTPESIELMIDSSRGDSEERAGSISVSDIKFAKEGEIESVGGTTEPKEPSDPTGAASFQISSTDIYTVDPSNTAATSFHVTYEGVKGNTYANLYVADAATLAAGKDTLTVTIKNNGTAPVHVRIDLQGTTKVGETDACNRSSTCTGGTEHYTDIKWGGTRVVLAANEEVTLTITYDGEGAQGAVKAMLIYLDASRGNEETYSGDVTFSNFIFSKKA